MSAIRRQTTNSITLDSLDSTQILVVKTVHRYYKSTQRRRIKVEDEAVSMALCHLQIQWRPIDPLCLKPMKYVRGLGTYMEALRSIYCQPASIWHGQREAHASHISSKAVGLVGDTQLIQTTQTHRARREGQSFLKSNRNRISLPQDLADIESSEHRICIH